MPKIRHGRVPSAVMQNIMFVRVLTYASLIANGDSCVSRRFLFTCADSVFSFLLILCFFKANLTCLYSFPFVS